MERRPKRLLPGCLVWVITFLLVSGCLVPASLFVAGMSTFFSEELITSTLGTYMCPENTDPKIHTYQSNEIDVDGFSRNATYYEMTCLNASGEVVENLGGSYALIWSGIIAVISLIPSSLIAFFLTILFFRIFKKRNSNEQSLPSLVKIQ
ncbi:MAG TPA: hypothetical protein VK856_12745 [Anaerolineaceae bacterium]|nr:hypothetical protein [Anaerolineaceae bacterium]